MRNSKRVDPESHLTRNVLLNMTGTILPLPVALISIPILIENLGTDLFGILTIAWMFVGYFNLFDFGMSRALVKLLSELIGTGKQKDIVPLIWTALICLGILGFFAGALVALASPVFVGSLLKIPSHLQKDALLAFYILSASIPIVITSTALRGILESHQRFGVINAVRVPLGIFNYLGPLLILPFYKGLVPVVTVLVLGRLIVWFVYIALCIKTIPGLMRGFVFDTAAVKRLVRFGSWMTVSNVIGPVMVYFDRLFIGMYLSVSAVAYYTTPYEVATKLWLLTGALMPVFFSAFSSALAEDSEKANRILARGTNYIFVLVFPLTLFLVMFSHDGLALWINEEFAGKSSQVLQCIAIGVFVNSLAQVFFAAIQGSGRPDVTAKIHMIELPLYLLFLWWTVTSFGIVGAALAWTSRVTFDAMALAWYLKKILPDIRAYLKLALFEASILCGVLVYGALLVKESLSRGIFFAVIVVIFAMAEWRYKFRRNKKLH